MNDTVEGFILKQTDYRDSDAIVTVLTREYGKLSFVVAGAQKLTSKNARFVFPNTKASLSFDYKEGKTMFRLKTARSVQMYRKSHEDLEKSFAANILCEMVDAFSLEGLESDGIEEEFTYLEIGLQAIEEGKDLKTVVCLFLADMMEVFGIAPDVDECVRCGNTMVTSISIKDGGFLCNEHAHEAGVPTLSSEDLKRFRLLVKGGLEHLDIVVNTTTATNSDILTLEEMVLQHSGFKIRSFSLFNRIFGIEK